MLSVIIIIYCAAGTSVCLFVTCLFVRLFVYPSVLYGLNSKTKKVKKHKTEICRPNFLGQA